MKGALEARVREPVFVLAGFVGVLLALLLGTVAFAPALSGIAASIVLFFGLLPILNAVADFGSCGATRLFLRRGLEGAAWKWALVDLGVGGLFFLGIGAGLILAVQTIVWLGGSAPIDLALLFADAGTEGSIRHDPWPTPGSFLFS